MKTFEGKASIQEESFVRPQESPTTTAKMQSRWPHYIVIEDEIMIRAGYIGYYPDACKAKETASQIGKAIGMKVSLQRTQSIEPIARKYVLEKGIAWTQEADPEKIYAELAPSLWVGKGEVRDPFELYVAIGKEPLELEPFADKLKSFGLNAPYNANALLSHFDKFLSFQAGGNYKVVPDTYLAHEGTHFELSYIQSSGPTPTKCMISTLSSNTGRVEVGANLELSCAPGNSGWFFDVEHVGRGNMNFLDPQTGKWFSAIGGAGQPVKAGYHWRHAWETFQLCLIRKVKIKAVSSYNHYVQLNPVPNSNLLTTAYQNTQPQNEVFTLVQLPATSSGNPEIVCLIAANNQYVDTGFEFELVGSPRHLKTGWNTADRGQALEVHRINGNQFRLQGPQGYVYINNHGVYGDGTLGQSDIFEFEYV